MKKTFYIIFTIIIILITFYVVIKYFIPNEPEENIFTNFFPNILSIITNETGNSLNTPNNTVSPSELDLPSLYQIENHQSVDFIINTATSSPVNKDFIISAEKNTGHLYFYDLNSRELTRLTNTTIPNVSNIYSGFSGDRLYVYIKSINANGNIETYSYNFSPNNIDSRATNATKLNSFINIVASSKNNIYWQNTNNGNILKDSIDLSAGEVILTNNQIDWQYKATNDYLLVYQKPSGVKETSAYKVENNILEKIISNKTSLTVLPSPDGKYILYTTGGNSIDTFLHNIDSKLDTKLSFSTPVEKCAWLENSLSLYCTINSTNQSFSLEDWYSGIFQLLDNRIVSLNTNNPQIIYPTKLLTNTIDTEKILNFNEGQYISFKNKPDQSLWVLKLNI